MPPLCVVSPYLESLLLSCQASLASKGTYSPFPRRNSAHPHHEWLSPGALSSRGRVESMAVGDKRSWNLREGQKHVGPVLSSPRLKLGAPRVSIRLCGLSWCSGLLGEVGGHLAC